MTVAPLDHDRIAEIRSIATMTQGVLDRIVEGYGQVGIELPDRRFTKTGTPTVDCEQLVVVFRQAYIGPPGDEASDPQNCNGPRTAVLEVHLTRCIPTAPPAKRPVAPSSEVLQSASEQQMTDCYLLLDLAPFTEQWDALGGRGLGVIATVEAGEPQGKYQTTVLNLTMAIP